MNCLIKLTSEALAQVLRGDGLPATGWSVEPQGSHNAMEPIVGHTSEQKGRWETIRDWWWHRRVTHGDLTQIIYDDLERIGAAMSSLEKKRADFEGANSARKGGA